MDFLGLKTLSVITRAVDLIKEIKGIDIDIEKVDITDKKVLDLFCRGQSKGIFQFESGGMQDLLMKMKPEELKKLYVERENEPHQAPENWKPESSVGL